MRLCEPFEHAVAIIGMQHLSEEVLVRGPLLGGVTGQPLDLRAEVEAAGRAEIFDVDPAGQLLDERAKSLSAGALRVRDAPQLELGHHLARDRT